MSLDLLFGKKDLCLREVQSVDVGPARWTAYRRRRLNTFCDIVCTLDVV